VSAVSLSNIVKRFGDYTAVHQMSLDIEEGSFVTLLGPVGLRQDNNLRMIAGLLDPSEGEISIKGKRVNDVPIHKRNLGLVFQNYALFPHKTVAENVAFGLNYRNVGKEEARRKVAEALELVQLPDLGARYPKELSGGQQQRIALARAIVIEPDVLLLDEPLSALDANLREDMRVELKRIQQSIGVTTVFVTHDQTEALAMSDQIIVMSEGRVEQIGAPEEVYNTPATRVRRQFLGASNLLSAKCTAVEGGEVQLDLPSFPRIAIPVKRAPGVAGPGPVRLVIRAEKLHLQPAGSAAEGMLSVDAIVENVDYQGQSARYFLRVGDHQMQAINMIEDHPFAAGAKVALRFRAKDCAALPVETAIREIRKQPFLPEPFPAAGAGRSAWHLHVGCRRQTLSRRLVRRHGQQYRTFQSARHRCDAAADGEVDLRLPAAFRDRTKRAARGQGGFAVARWHG
jgi:putative spermidine/putrescine transport system ATP-binding protein